MNLVIKGYLRLARPANLPTAAADIFAGISISGVVGTFELSGGLGLSIVYLVLSSVSLYAGGVVLNDVFDFELDKIERPERPIPSGVIQLKSASFFGAILLIFGVFFGFLVHPLSGFIASALALSILSYDAYSKKHRFLGPLNMGICRGLNLILGMSILGEINKWWYAVIPVTYIFAITLISRGEVHGNNRSHIIWAGILYAMVILGVVAITQLSTLNMLQSLPFLVLLIFLIYRPLINAYRLNSPGNIKKAVIAGVVSIIVLDASVAVGFSTWWYGLLMLLLLPLSLFLSKLFAVT